MNNNKLKFGQGNAKLPKWIATFSLPAGYACPGARECLAMANRISGKITNGQKQVFRCFSASTESLFPSVRKARWANFDLLKNKSVSDMVALILTSWNKSPVTRIHISGDFFSQDYFDAWLEVAKLNPKNIFYAYTKSLNYWVKRLGDIPENFRLVASKGGKWDSLIEKHNLKFAQVVYSEQQAADLKLEIDHDDTHAWKYPHSFALLIHGMQTAGSEAAKAKNALKGKGSYGKGLK